MAYFVELTDIEVMINTIYIYRRIFHFCCNTYKDVIFIGR